MDCCNTDSSCAERKSRMVQNWLWSTRYKRKYLGGDMIGTAQGQEIIYNNHLLNRYAFAQLPTASTFGFGVAWVTDVGVGPGSMWQCDGTNWTPVNGSCLLAQSGTATSAGSNVIENTLVSVAIPANVMGANGSLNVESIWSCNSSVSSKTVNIYFGTTTSTGTKFMTAAMSGANQSQHDWRYIQNQNN